MIDLHMHSTFSDGTLTPEVLVAQAAGYGLSAIALTDHDGMEGVDPFLKASETAGPRGIAGVEMSAEVSRGTMHILGYFVDHTHTELNEALQRIRGGRAARNREILRKLVVLGCPLEWDEVTAFTDEEVVGRPHFAMAMQARGYVKDKTDAFNRYLAKGRPAYVDRLRLDPDACIAVIRKAGGVAVLAHPYTLALGEQALRKRVAELRDMGLQGIEVFYSEHTEAWEAAYRRMAAELGLAMSGGSDYHGDVNPRIRMGIGFGGLRVPDELVADLEARRG